MDSVLNSFLFWPVHMKTLGTEQKSMRNASSNDVRHHRIQNLCFHPFTRKREAGIFKNLHYGDRSRKTRNFGACFCVNGRLKCRKKSLFPKHISGYVWTGPNR